MVDQQADTGSLSALASTANVIAGTDIDSLTEYTLHDGKVVRIFKCRPKNIGLVLGLLAEVMESLGINRLGAEVGSQLSNPQVILKLIAIKSDRVLFVASELCSLTYEEMQEVDLDDALQVLRRVVEVNQKFFMESVWPVVQSFLPPDPEKKTEETKDQQT